MSVVVVATCLAITAAMAWRLGSGGLTLLTHAGVDPVLPSDSSAAAFFGKIRPSGQMYVTGILPGSPPRLGYATRSPNDTSGFVVYGERFPHPDRRVVQSPESPFAGLDLAAYLGRQPSDAQLRGMTSAGHFAPLLIADGHAQFLNCCVEPPIGVGDDRVTPTSVTVNGPATLLAFTDGFVERSPEVIDVGLERLRRAALEAADRNVDDLLDRLTSALAPDGRDDAVIVGLRWTR